MGHMFSTRVPDSLTPNELTRRLERLRTAGVPLVDLTESNPTRVGIEYPRDLLDGLAARYYEPHPLGLPVAREAVAHHLARCGVRVTPERIVLTASTSEAYSLLFKLLCDPGDVVLVPRPSYPLFEPLTRLEAVVGDPYMMEYERRWLIDPAAIQRQLEGTSRARAILIVNPNNPTGSCVTRDELAGLSSIARSRNIAIISDEVFAEYAFALGRSPSALDGDSPGALTFCLGGLSKSIGLPQVKLAWIAIGGPDHLVAATLDRLEHICDAYLSVSSPVQHAAPALLAGGVCVRDAIAQRVRGNYLWLRHAVAHHPSCQVLESDGGWSAVIRVPAIRSEESLVLELLEVDRVLVHPGYFFDFPSEAYVVVSLLPEPENFHVGIARLLARAGEVGSDRRGP